MLESNPFIVFYFLTLLKNARALKHNEKIIYINICIKIFNTSINNALHFLIFYYRKILITSLCARNYIRLE